jgi:signal transduction histidine kinase
VKLSQFIVDNTETLLSEWEDFARTILPAAGAMGVEQLRDGARDLLRSITAEMETPETADEQKAKSRGKRIGPQADTEPGRNHRADRFAQGFDLEQVASEYRALRASVVRLWAEKQGSARPGLDELTRFHEAVDANLADALRRFSADVNHSRDLVMAVLGHDLRSPLGAITNSAHYLLRLQDADAGQKKAASLIASSAARMAKMVSDLLDFTRTRLGDLLPISPEPMHLIDVCRRSIDEQWAFHPDAIFSVEGTGDLSGTWDPSRVSQLLSNLIGNAIQHGAAGTPISILATSEPDAVVLSVHNAGVPIAATDLHRIFDPLARAPTERPDPTSLGLGLYIAREVARAHGGTIAVASSKDEGTTFTLRLPRTQQTLASPPARPMPPSTHLLSTIISPNEAFGFFSKLERH